MGLEALKLRYGLIIIRDVNGEILTCREYEVVVKPIYLIRFCFQVS